MIGDPIVPSIGHVVHVTPTSDDIDHELTEECPCGPQVIPQQRANGSVGWVITHHSLDGREASEGSET